MDSFTSPNHTISSAASQGDLYANCADGDQRASTIDVGDACTDVTITPSQRRRSRGGRHKAQVVANDDIFAEVVVQASEDREEENRVLALDQRIKSLEKVVREFADEHTQWGSEEENWVLALDQRIKSLGKWSGVLLTNIRNGKSSMPNKRICRSIKKTCIATTFLRCRSTWAAMPINWKLQK